MPRTLDDWLGRTEPLHDPAKDLADYPDHHMALLVCPTCGEERVSIYPKQAKVERLLCVCGSRRMELKKYIRYIYKQ